MREFTNCNYNADIDVTVKKVEVINNEQYVIKFSACGKMIAPATQINSEDVDVDYQNATYTLSYDNITVEVDPSIYTNTEFKGRESLIEKYYEEILDQIVKTKPSFAYIEED